MFASADGKQVQQLLLSGTVYKLIISHATFRDCHVHIFSNNLLEIAVNIIFVQT